MNPIIAFIKSIGRWTTAHPWISLFIPASQTATFIATLLAALTPDDLRVLAPGVIGPALLYPFRPNLTQQRLFRVPDEPSAFHLSLLRFPDPAQVSAMLAQNRALYDSVVAVGGRRYVIGAIPDFTPADWEQHFGPAWDFLVVQGRGSPTTFPPLQPALRAGRLARRRQQDVEMEPGYIGIGDIRQFP